MIRRDESKYSDSISRTSSASRRSLNDVNPVRSANSTDTWRRSTDAAGTAGAGTAVPPAAAPGSWEPHSRQNRWPAWPATVPHASQRASSGVPH